MRLVGDQIVEINGKRVSAFDEFLERFLAAQVQAELKAEVKRDEAERITHIHILYIL